MLSKIGFLLFCFFIKVCHAQLRQSSDLNCDFSKPCLWQNASTFSDAITFTVVSDALADPRFPSSQGDQENFFARTMGPSGFMGQVALLSEIIECQLGGAKLRFWHFHTGRRSSIDVCLRYPPGSPLQSSLHCFAPGSNARAAQWQLASVELPPMTQPMELLIRANFESPGHLVAVDDITYEAILCESSHRGAAEGGGGPIDDNNNSERDTVVPIPIPIPTVTQKSERGEALVPFDKDQFAREIRAKTTHLFADQNIDNFDISDIATAPKKSFLNGTFDCDFDDGTLCAYQNLGPDYASKISTNLHPWQLSNKPIANPLTGIQKDYSGSGWFLYAGSAADSAAVYVFESRESIPSEDDTSMALHFRYHLAGIRGRLRVCFAIELADFQNLVNFIFLDGLCPFQREGMAELVQLDDNVDPRAWRPGVVSVPNDPSPNNKMFFVADLLPKNYFVGLDSIKLVNQTEEKQHLEENILAKF